MKQTLTILIFMAMLALVSATWPADESEADLPSAGSADSSEQLIRRVQEQTLRAPVFQTRLIQYIDLFGQRLVGQGTYVQHASPRGLQIRLDWQSTIGDQTASVQHISDGRFLWVRSDLLDGPVLERVDLERVREPRATSADATMQLPISAARDMVVLGVPRLLENILQCYRLAPLRSAQLEDQTVWVVEGQWKSAEDSESGGSRGKGRDANAAQLPNYLRVIIQQEDLILRRIEYLHVHADRRATGTDPSQATYRMLAVIDFIESSFPSHLDEGLFDFPTGGDEIVDRNHPLMRYLEPRTAD
jgi:hypothetical protein